ncbi:hypothetical protein BDZ45DRAFT_601216 [Acephala macrosclerotiorum]|nr:hypothetical protein BDZ45DRAFT_601216 [Acephala macrosclerotiorum]
MVDRMTALGLASNFVNFADFWIKRFGKAHEIHKSAEALSTNNVSIAKASETTQTFQSRLTINQKSNTGCYETADELLQIPVALKMQGKKMAWKSMRQAIKII